MMRFITDKLNGGFPWFVTDGIIKRTVANQAEAQLLVDSSLAIYEQKPGGVQVNIAPALVSAIPTHQQLIAQIPLTVQGASEAFINSSLGQVIVNSNTNTNFLGASIINRKNEIIAKIDATHPAS